MYSLVFDKRPNLFSDIFVEIRAYDHKAEFLKNQLHCSSSCVTFNTHARLFHCAWLIIRGEWFGRFLFQAVQSARPYTLFFHLSSFLLYNRLFEATERKKNPTRSLFVLWRHKWRAVAAKGKNQVEYGNWFNINSTYISRLSKYFNDLQNLHRQSM